MAAARANRAGVARPPVPRPLGAGGRAAGPAGGRRAADRGGGGRARALAADSGAQVVYLGSLLALLGGGGFVVARQVLVRRELEMVAQDLGERVRKGDASSEDYYELGVILLRKRLNTAAITNLEKALEAWEGEEVDKAQVHNALGFAYFKQDKWPKAIENYQVALDLQPGYVTALNNLGDAYEKSDELKKALAVYQETLAFQPGNKTALERSTYLEQRIRILRLDG